MTRPGLPSVLPPAPAGIMPFIVRYSGETPLPVRLGRDRVRGRLRYADETRFDRDGWGTLWERVALPPKGRRGSPRPEHVHPYRQRRAMLDLWCQICRRPVDPDYAGPYLFLHRADGGPLKEGERTDKPPVHVVCAGVSVQLCPRLRGSFAGAWVEHAPTWGMKGAVYHPQTLDLHQAGVDVPLESPYRRWTIAFSTVVELQGVTPLTPADLEDQWARLGRDRLEHEFERIAKLAMAA
ncbi:hypothetical protein [Streptomyces sp. PsTaAH-124]|uniref:hypothetical protein n=1 Tax=Streptomyces sp. PsTaAH-124 TaxID=1157638 RepID=UPI0003816B6E|nr:hypothetical protein [Streptomyces sp. PsTaAH-124]